PAARLGALYRGLDGQRGAARLTGGGGHAWHGAQVDVAEFRAPDRGGDLRGRDFTVNALAVPANQLARSGEAAVEDPTGGLHDLGTRLVRLCSPCSLDDDPVRVLRAARLAMGPGWTLGPGIDEAATRPALGLSRVSAERLRD